MSATKLLQLYERRQAEENESSSNIDTLEEYMNGTDDDVLQFSDELGTTDCVEIRKVIAQYIIDNKQLQTDTKYKLKKLENKLKRKGVDMCTYRHLKIRQEANIHENDDWKTQCDAYLDQTRPCTKTINNVTIRVPFGASGYVGSSATHEENDEVDVIEDTPAMENDAGDILRYYNDANDASGCEIPTHSSFSGALHVFNFRIQPKLALQMKPHQLEAAEMIIKEVGHGNSGFLLAHSMGLGKTLTTIATLCAFFHVTKNIKCMVVCPKTVQNEWFAELLKWNDYLNFTYYEPVDEDKPLTIEKWKRNGGLIIIGNDRYRIQMQKESVQIDFMILDEAHRLKNIDTNFYQTVKDFSPARKLLLTGSPLQNHLMEYHAMLDLIQPNFMNAAEFRKEFVKIIERGAMADANDEEVTAAQIKINVLQRRFSRHIHRRSVAVLKAS